VGWDLGGEGSIRYLDAEEQDEGDAYGKRRTLLLINKSDLLDYKQRRAWADYFDTQNIQYAFFSAARAAEVLEREQLAEQEKLAAEEEAAALAEEEGEDEDEDDEEDPDQEHPATTGSAADGAAEDGSGIAQQLDDAHLRDDGDLDEDEDGITENATLDPRTRILTVTELEELFLSSAPPLENFPEVLPPQPPKPKHPHAKATQSQQPSAPLPSRILTVGLVGYPNVGKSSTINALLGSKKVSVSATPGKTKHFQTLHLSPDVILCDCPGLVFPQFATTSAELIVDGVLPIDQMREYTGPAELVARRIPQDILEGEYGFPIEVLPVEEGGTGEATGLEVLSAYARARGFVRQGQGNPDESRSARYVLKDYVNARLLYCHPPPKIVGDAEVTSSVALEEGDADEFNAGIRDRARRRIAQRRGRGIEIDFDKQTHGTVRFNPLASIPEQGAKSKALDSAFFRSSLASGAGMAARPSIMGRRATPGASAVEGRIGPDGLPVAGARLGSEAGGLGSKKHHNKGGKRKKVRSGSGYD